MVGGSKEPIEGSHPLLIGVRPTVWGSLKRGSTRYADRMARGSRLHLRIGVIIQLHFLREMVLRAQRFIAKKVVDILGWVELPRRVEGIGVMK
ncbi:hypothetical protein Hanom_Chr01g00088381 [Helianthus anomalus]